MRKLVVLILSLGSIGVGLVGAQQSEPPAWAYNVVNTPPAGGQPAAAAPDDGRPRSFRAAAARSRSSRFATASAPPTGTRTIIRRCRRSSRRGRKPDVRACSLCHYPNGKGRPENAGVAGLPRSYFLQTMADFRSGDRKSAEARKANTNIMITIAKGMTDEELAAAADYFGSMKWTPWIKVVEADTVPKTRVAGGMFLKVEGNATEPIGNRIIEMPDDAERTEVLRDPRSAFTAYVPKGSLAKGKTLVTQGGGKTVQCGVCHGADLKGLGPVPGLAGRSPSYVVRQLFDMQQGARKGVWTELMMPVVKNLTNDDMLAIAAYTASLAP